MECVWGVLGVPRAVEPGVKNQRVEKQAKNVCKDTWCTPVFGETRLWVEGLGGNAAPIVICGVMRDVHFGESEEEVVSGRWGHWKGFCAF